MKNFFKKLAFVLALALLVSAIAPAAAASAAATPALNVTGKKLYLAKDAATGKYSNTFKLKVSNLGTTYKVTFASKNTKIATVSKWGTVTAVAPGEVTVVATVSRKSTGKVVKTLSAKFWIKKNATEIGVSTASASKLDNALSIGDKVKLNAFRKDINGNVAWKQLDKTVITDYLVWSSSNKAVAKVDKFGTVTAIAPGVAVITVKSVQSEAPSVATANTVQIPVVVKANGITDITQTTANTIQVTFGSEMDTVVTKDTLSVTPASSSYQIPEVKSVTFDSTKKIATVVFYADLEDGVTYALSVSDNNQINGEFVASVGAVASITITGPSSVLANSTAKEIEYVLKDKNGVEVNAASGTRVEFEIVDGDANGYLTTVSNVEKVAIFEAGKTVAVKATYYTGDYTTDGTEVSYSSNVYVVKGISATDVTLSSVDYTVTNDAYADIDWDTYTKNTTIALGDVNYKIQAFVVDSEENEYGTDNVADFTFESLDASKVEVDENGTLYPIALGTAYVKVTHVLSEKTFLVKITVGAEREITTFVLNKYTATVSNAVGVDEEVTFTATVKDQYGETVDVNFAGKITGNGTTSYTATAANFDTTADNKIVFNPAELAEGSYSYKVTVDDLVRNISITTKAPGTAATTKFVVSDSTFNLAVNEDNSAADSIKFSLYKVDAKGYKVEKVNTATGYSIAIVNPSGTAVSTVTTDSNNNFVLPVISVSGNALSKAITKKGTYTITVTDLVQNKVITKASFVITDTQVKPVVTQEATSVTVTGSYTLAQILEDNDMFSVKTSNDGTVNSDAVFEAMDIIAVTAPSGYVAGNALVTGTYKFVIKTVDVKETFENANYFIHEDVSVNKTVTITVK